MEDRRAVIAVFLLATVCCAFTIPVSGYDNIAAHPMINKYAVEYFAGQMMPMDPYLKDASLDGAPARGFDWNLSDGRRNVPSEGIIAILKFKSPAHWIIEGGFSQDEPEMWQSLRHFYDPENPGAPYLTDTGYLKKLGETIYGAEMSDPRTSAVDWAFDITKGNDYSYPKAKEYYKQALLSDDRNNRYYGMAWRSVGESMHMVADMAVPAHVRNDGHGIRIWIVPVNIDPYEESVNGRVIADYAAYPSLYPPANLNYDSAPRNMMEELARFTNRNFISQDSNPSYSLPDLTRSADANGYIMGTIDGRTYHVAKKTSWLADLVYESEATNTLENNPKLDWQVISDQQKILIPTAVRADAALLNRFLPRFIVMGEVKTSQEVQEGKPVTIYYLDGDILLKGKAEEWPAKLTIRNGASIVNSATGQRMTIPVGDTVGDNLNEFRYQFVPSDVGAKAGDKIYLEYDLGGYVVRSVGITIPEEYPTPTPTVTTDSGKTTPPPSGDRVSESCEIHQRWPDSFPDTRSICWYIYTEEWSVSMSHFSHTPKSPYTLDQFRTCGCCQYNTASAEIYADDRDNPDHVNSFIASACGPGTPVTTTIVPTPAPTKCNNQGVGNRDCECLCRCYKDAAERAKCEKDCSGGYAIFGCPYG